MTASPETSDRVTDFVLPQGCMLCGGQVSVRSTPAGGTHAYCRHCHWLSKPRLRMRKEGLEVAYMNLAAA